MMFLKKFQSQFVEIITKRDMVISQEDGSAVNAPLIVHGFVVDEDNAFVYLGENPLQISRAVSKADISLVEITDPSNYEEEMEFAGPETDEELN